MKALSVLATGDIKLDKLLQVRSDNSAMVHPGGVFHASNLSGFGRGCVETRIPNFDPCKIN